jgi:hypothetical protein
MRSFTVEAAYSSGRKLRFKGGRYMSEIPSNAAKKAFSQMSQKMKGRVTIEVHLRETTQGSAHKTYKYKVTRKYQPTEVQIAGQTIVYKYVTKVKAI